MRKVPNNLDAELGDFTGQPDHVHLLVFDPPKAAVSPR
jgi:REP element-mobilizing transposase RayT